MSYSIKQVADMMGVTTSTLRYYDQEGLLPDVERKNGIRVFEDKDFKWLRVLNCLKNTNMPIKKIKEYCDLAQKGDSTLNERYNLILEQKENILSQIKQLEYYLKEVEYKEWYYKQAIKEGTEKNIIANMPDTATLEIDKIPRKK
ncbi:MAG: MerR family transcriptional regulator [Clostridium sp. 26_22]|nr:MAG: MerR family transcriptional regulator [Clostridium sp. 26_22]